MNLLDVIYSVFFDKLLYMYVCHVSHCIYRKIILRQNKEACFTASAICIGIGLGKLASYMVSGMENFSKIFLKNLHRLTLNVQNLITI